jgi:hypothetical protein
MASDRSGVADVTSSERGRLSRVGGYCAVLAALILLTGIVGLAMRMPVLRSWLAVLFGINAGSGDVSLESLRVVAPVDLTLLALAGVAFSGFWPGPRRPHKVWMGLAILLPFAGITVLLATGLWGRSGLMGGGLVLSFLLIGDRDTRPVGYLGVAANLLLLTWLLWVAARLLAGESGGHT